ncbi:MAG: nucleoside hydrolase [Anaerolineales bacterium]
MVRLVIDTDPGVDDAHAILLAFAHPGARVEAIVTVAGNVGLPLTTANAATILDILQAPAEHTPIFAGADRALLGAGGDAAVVHGADGLGSSGYPASGRKIEAEHGALALIRLAAQAPGELTLVAIGPLTNLALALRLDPLLPQKYKSLVVMGGAIRSGGNMPPRPSTEFNIFTDPEAAAIVFDGWPGLSLVSWETTVQYLVSSELVRQMMGAGTPRAEFFRRITEGILNYDEKVLGQRGLFAPDPLAMAIAIEPGLVQRSELRAVTVELTGQHTRGQTTVDWTNLTGRKPNVNVILDVDGPRFFQLLLASVAA